MTSQEIWEWVNKELVFMGVLFVWIHDNLEDPRIGIGATKLKEMMPCFVGIDQEAEAIVFQSEDDGIVALHMNRVDEQTITLAMETNLTLEN